MAGEAVVSPMRLATAPGRLARPAPPGNDDPCGIRGCRTISEGMPTRRQGIGGRFQSTLPALAGLPAEASAKAGQRQARARARNPTWSAERRAFPSPGNARRLDADRA